MQSIDDDINKTSHRDRAAPADKIPLFNPCPVCGRNFGLDFEDLCDRLDCMQRALAQARGDFEELRLEIIELVRQRPTDIRKF